METGIKTKQYFLVRLTQTYWKQVSCGVLIFKQSWRLVCTGLFHSIMHIIRWPLREEISAYVIQLRSKALSKLGWPPRVWKQEIISKAQRKISSWLLSISLHFSSVFPIPDALSQHLQLCWLWKLCGKGNLWFQITESATVGVSHSRACGEKSKPQNQITNRTQIQ